MTSLRKWDLTLENEASNVFVFVFGFLNSNSHSYAGYSVLVLTRPAYCPVDLSVHICPAAPHHDVPEN